jgi:hypothetical protein
MKKLVVLDTECLPNYWLLAVKGLDSGKVMKFEAYGEKAMLSKSDISQIKSILSTKTTFGFNSKNYDLPMIAYALSGATCEKLHKQSMKLIGGQSERMAMRDLSLDYPKMDHFDICDPAPAVMISLKNYGTRIRSKKLWDFFVDPKLPIDRKTADEISRYCENDLEVTIDLYRAITDRINLRILMGEEYGLDLRSKSDAQIAEAVIVSELSSLGVIVNRPDLPSYYTAKYKAPDYIHFKSNTLNDILDLVNSTSFSLTSNGQVEMPKELAHKKIIIGNTTYKMGIGGLHSQEKKLAVTSTDTHVLRNADFTSYYPFIILNNSLAPKHLGKKFLDVYRRIVNRRIRAKQEGDTLTADSLKITINGSFGKFGSKYSVLYSPDLLLGTTITGQLTLLMLIEQFEANDISVISANTDGLEYYCHRDKIQLAETIIFDLELITGYEMEHGEYLGLYARDVNNYIAKYKGKVKAKGIYAEPSLSKGLQTPIVFEAVRKYILNFTPMEDTINECTDVNKFLSARTVNGGGVWNGKYLGKMVRWYYSTDGCSINYKLNGNLVPKTGEGVHPMMDILDEIPSNLNYDWYYKEAIAVLEDLGVSYVK